MLSKNDVSATKPADKKEVKTFAESAKTTYETFLSNLNQGISPRFKMEPDYKPPVPIGPLVSNFLKSDHPFAPIMNQLENHLKPIATNVAAKREAAKEAAKLALQRLAVSTPTVQVPNSIAFSATSTAPKITEVEETAELIQGLINIIPLLAGYEHLESYFNNPQLYTEQVKTKLATRSERLHHHSEPLAISSASSSNNTNKASTVSTATNAGSMTGENIAFQSAETVKLTPIEKISESCEAQVKALIYRLAWFVKLSENAKKDFDPNIFVQMMSFDRDWGDGAIQCKRNAESEATKLTQGYPQKLNAFRALQKREGIACSHSAQLRRDIEKAGFTFRPMMIKRDRYICEICGIEVTGWRAWHDPRSFHNYGAHPVSFRKEQYPDPKRSAPMTASTSTLVAAAATMPADKSIDFKS